MRPRPPPPLFSRDLPPTPLNRPVPSAPPAISPNPSSAGVGDDHLIGLTRPQALKPHAVLGLALSTGGAPSSAPAARQQ